MPTMPKLFAAVLVALLGYVAADRVALHLPPEVQHGLLRPMTALFGILVGWRFLGPKMRRGSGMNAAIGLGISAGLVLALVSLTFFAGVEMIRRAMRKSYGGDPFAGLQDMIQIALDYTKYLYHGDVLGVLLFGSVVVGVIVEIVARRWT